jgi:hypothetical protein
MTDIFRNPDGSLVTPPKQQTLTDEQKQKLQSKYIDLTKYPAPDDFKADYRGWLNELLKMADKDDMNPLLKPHADATSPTGYVNDDGTPFEDYDYKQHIPPFEALSSVGDVRFSMGHALSAVQLDFFPRMELYTQILQAGGCQIIDEYICDQDGNPIQKSYCATTPTQNITLKELEIKPQEVVDYIFNKYEEYINYDVGAFYKYITDNYSSKGFSIRLLTIQDFPYFFFAELTFGDIKSYYKYPIEQKDLIAKAFNLPIQEMPQVEITKDLITQLNKPVSSYYL